MKPTNDIFFFQTDVQAERFVISWRGIGLGAEGSAQHLQLVAVRNERAAESASKKKVGEQRMPAI